jgi:hypothetical protein
MFGESHSAAVVAIAAIVGCACASPARAVSFTTSYADGGTWSTLFAQGFKPSVSPSPNPGHPAASMVNLDRFQFFKSGATTYDVGGVETPIPPALNVQLAIVANSYFVNLATFTTTSPELLGLSTNTIADVGTIATGNPITFNFNHLPLTYGANTPEEIGNNNYGAILVTNNGGSLSPVRVPAIIVDYISTNEIESDYGQPGNYFLSASNFMHTNTFGSYLDAFNATDSGLHGDANFIASFDLPAEIAGDFNSSGTVDAADYTVWRDGLGGVYGPGDYGTWKANFGMTSGGAGALAIGGTAVPEPAVAVLVLVPLVPWMISARRRVRI